VLTGSPEAAALAPLGAAFGLAFFDLLTNNGAQPLA
jgi:hypothetical protein